MSFLGPIGDYVTSTFHEIGKHPLQAMGAALGVPGYDPAIGGTFNNHKGGALLSPTGNFSSSAWNEMYKDNPDKTSGLNTFHSVNKIADIIAPLIAGGYAAGSGIGTGSGTFGGGLLGGGGGGSGGAAGLIGQGSGTGGLLGSTPEFAMPGGTSGVTMGGLGESGFAGSSGPMTGLFSGLSPTASSGAFSSGAAAAPMGGVTGGSGTNWASMAQQGFKLLQNMGQQQNQQQAQQQMPPAQLGGDSSGAAALQAMSQRLNNLYSGGRTNGGY
ncbi:hypothetical protein [Burkholderia vietnamiensis]|uniref:hypothetical protein n=1 Tax=Burkholderia vietnamiensis TaxID=60552 RepID=UPI000A4E5E69|nr:hypothetical protein [Burkholderia vietnamiensis]